MVQLVLDHPIAAVEGDSFVLRDTAGQRTLGGGRFLDLRAPARKRRRPERLAQLAAHANADPQSALSALLGQPAGFVDLSSFSRDRALSDGEVENVVARTGAIRVIHADGVAALAPETWLRLLTGVRATLEEFHAQNPDLPGLGIEPLRLQLEPRLPDAVFAAILQRLARTGELSLDTGWVRLAGHEVAMTKSDEVLWQQIGPLIGGSVRFRPPRVRDIARCLDIAEQEVRRVMRLAGRKGLVREIAHDHFLTRSSVMELAEVICELAESAQGGAFPVAQLRDRLSISRKIAVHILEFFDHHGATARRGDLRRVNARRLNRFRAPAD